MKIKEGEVFAVKISLGYGFLQFVSVGNVGVEIVRVLNQILENDSVSQEQVNLKERFSIQFVLKAALSRKLVHRVGTFSIPQSYEIPKTARSEHNVQGERIGWHIVDQLTLQRVLKKKLNAKELLLSPHGIPNDTLLIE